MIQERPSIFNDVLGPVMRGPSSSHAAAAVRIGKLLRELCGNKVAGVVLFFDKDDPLASSYEGHGSAMGFIGGLLGYEPDNPRLPEAKEEAQRMGIEVSFSIKDMKGADRSRSFSNTYFIEARGALGSLSLTAVSTGGGMIDIIRFNNFDLTMKGDYYELLIPFDGETIPASEVLEKAAFLFSEEDSCFIREDGDGNLLLQVKSTEPITKESQVELSTLRGAERLFLTSPVLPVKSSKHYDLPFEMAEEMLAFCQERNFSLWEAALAYEVARSGLLEDEVLKKMANLTTIMSSSIDEGLNGTFYKDRILHQQSHLIRKNRKSLPDSPLLQGIIQSISAIMEVKSAMGTIVAAPTAGSCGCLAGTVLGAARTIGAERSEVVKAMLGAGIVGIFIAGAGTFAGEIGACQVECGSGSAMAAAALVQLYGGSAEQALTAASMALQASLGLACDPVADRVEVPCLGKNILGGSNALSCATMALAGYAQVIPFDEVIEAMNDVSARMPLELRCTGLGGLALSKSAKNIYTELNT